MRQSNTPGDFDTGTVGDVPRDILCESNGSLGIGFGTLPVRARGIP